MTSFGRVTVHQCGGLQGLSPKTLVLPRNRCPVFTFWRMWWFSKDRLLLRGATERTYVLQHASGTRLLVSQGDRGHRPARLAPVHRGPRRVTPAPSLPCRGKCAPPYS